MRSLTHSLTHSTRTHTRVTHTHTHTLTVQTDRSEGQLTQTVKAYEYCVHSISASSSLHCHQHCMHSLSSGSTPWMLMPLFGMTGMWCPCSVRVIMVTVLWCVCQSMSWRYSGCACTPFRSCFSGPFMIGVWKWPLFSGKDVMWVLDTVTSTCFEKSVSLLKVSWYQF